MKKVVLVLLILLSKQDIIWDKRYHEFEKQLFWHTNRPNSIHVVSFLITFSFVSLLQIQRILPYFENILLLTYFPKKYFIILLRWCGLICHVAWCFIFLERCDQATVTIKHRCWHQLVLDMTWYENEFDFNMFKQRCQLNTDVDININWFRTCNNAKIYFA